jgi:hypothetical protein
MAYNDIYKLVIHQRQHGQEVINKLHFLQDSISPGNLSQDLADDFRTNMDTAIRQRAHTDFVFEYIEVQRIVPFGDGAAISAWPANTKGTWGAPYPLGSGTLAEVITIHSSQVGRRRRGRIYLAGHNRDQVENGLWRSEATTKTQTFATALATRYMVLPTPSFWVLGVWSRVIAGPNPPFSTDAFTRASALTVRTTVRNQRRRQLGVGR